LKNKLGVLPQDPQAQNALWYRLYQKHSAEMRISEAHRFYLLTRDMTTISAVCLLLFSIGVVLASVAWQASLLYAAALLVQYLLVATAARNYGNRFVLNVLSQESHAG